MKRVDFHLRMDEKLYKKLELLRKEREDQLGVTLSMNNFINLVMSKLERVSAPLRREGLK